MWQFWKTDTSPFLQALWLLLFVAVVIIVTICFFSELTEIILCSLHLLSCVATKVSAQLV